MKKLLVTLLGSLAGILLQAQAGLNSKIAEIAASPVLKTALVGVKAVRSDGRILADYESCHNLVPASNLKLVTAGTALYALGEDYRYTTSLAYTGSIEDGVLEGDLYIVGGGDPTFGSSDEMAPTVESVFGIWKGFLDSAGIKEVRGSVIGDGRWSDSLPWNGAWSYGDLGFYYGILPGGLNFYENSVDITVSPGESPGNLAIIVQDYPETPWMSLSSTCTTSAPGTGYTLNCRNTPFLPEALLTGSVAQDRNVTRERCSNMFPAYTCAYYFYNYLVANGVKVDREFGDIAPGGCIRRDLLLYNEEEMAVLPQEMTFLGGTQSPKLKEIIAKTLYESDNFYAEALLKTLGKTFSSSAATDSALVAESRILSRMGTPDDGIRIVDGCGLARSNCMSPDFIVRFLEGMTRTEVFETYLDCLPQVGKGTLRPRLPNASEQLRSRVYMKSGSMSGVRCYSGYILPCTDGKDSLVTFSIMTNNTKAPSSQVLSCIDKIIEMLAEAD